MTPVTGSITNGKEDGFILPCRTGKRFSPPGIPVNRVICVLEKVRTLFMDEPVMVFFRCIRVIDWLTVVPASYLLIGSQR